MKKIIIGTITGTLICFIWQSLAWMALPVHENAIKYTPAQDSIMLCLSKHLNEDAVFALPTVDPDSKNYMADAEKIEKESIGKPWALVFYHTSFQPFSAGYLVNGILMIMVSVLMVVIILYLGRNSFKTYAQRYMVIMLMAVFCIFQAVLDDWNWWSFPTHFIQTQIFDLFFCWALCGMFLAWYMKPPKEKETTT